MADPLGDEFDAADAAAAASASGSATVPDASGASTDTTAQTDSGQAASPVATPDPANPAVQQAATPAQAGASSQQQPTEPKYAGARDFVAKALGWANAETYGDDAAFLTALVEGQKTAQQQLQQMQQLAQFGQMYLNERQQAHRTQQTPAAAADPFAAYKAPEFNPAWQGMVERNPETGEWKVRGGADPSILPKFLAYQQYRQEMGDKFLSNPVDFIKPIVTQLAQEQAKAMIQEQFGQQESTQYVNSFMQQNSNWLFQTDSAGNRVANPMTGKPVFSAAGNRFYQHLRDAEQSGITNPQAQEKYARALLMADLSRPQHAVANGDQAKADLLKKMNRNPNASGSFVGSDQSGHTAPAQSQEGLSLNDRLRNALSKFSDADVGV